MPLTDTLRLSEHGKLRMAQRDITQQDIDYVLLHGEVRMKAGRRGDRMEVALTRRHIAPEDLGEYGCLAGAVLILDGGGRWLITAYKTRAVASRLRTPYARERMPWRIRLEEGLIS